MTEQQKKIDPIINKLTGEQELYPKVSEDPKIKSESKGNNNTTIIIQNAVKVANEIVDIVDKVHDGVDIVEQKIEKLRIEHQLKHCKYERQYWTPDEIKAEIEDRIAKFEKNYIFVKEEELNRKKLEPLVTEGKIKIEQADQDEVIEELYPNKLNSCCHISMRDVKITGIENIKISWM